MSDLPLVSAIITTHNGEAFLEETIQTLLTQSYPQVEMIAVDHGSTDKSKQIIEAYPNIDYVYQEHKGNAHARNTGIKRARGDFIALIDHDDKWHSKKLEKQMSVLLENPELLFTISHFRFFLTPGTPLPSWARKEAFDDPKPDFSPSSLVARKEAFEVNGYFSEDLRLASDTDWFFLAKDRELPMKVVPEELHQRRIHNTNQSHDLSNIHRELIHVIRKSVKRKKRV